MILNIINTKVRKISTFAKPLNALNNVCTYLRKLGTAFIAFNGLNNRNVRNARIATPQSRC
jgi:hypothetical protein